MVLLSNMDSVVDYSVATSLCAMICIYLQVDRSYFYLRIGKNSWHSSGTQPEVTVHSSQRI